MVFHIPEVAMKLDGKKVLMVIPHTQFQPGGLAIRPTRQN
jgi:hypothetical protein